MSDTTVYSFRKNSQEEVRATLGEYNGKQVFSIRSYSRTTGGEWRPTPKGITLQISQIDEFLKAVRHLADALGVPD